MQQEENHPKHVINLHQNQDKVFKEGLDLYKDGSLEFLDSDLSGEVTDILSTEITVTTTKKSYADNALKVLTKDGVMGVHCESEVQISNDDLRQPLLTCFRRICVQIFRPVVLAETPHIQRLRKFPPKPQGGKSVRKGGGMRLIEVALMRFLASNVDLTRKHGIQFTTIIVTIKPPSATEYKSPSVSFTPKIINLKDRDADIVLAGIEQKLQAEKHGEVNPLEVVYLPLYGSKSGKTTPELFDSALKLVPRFAKDDVQKQRKIRDLMILLVGSFLSNVEINKILEANMINWENNSAIRVLEDRGIMKVARNLLQDGDDIQRVSKVTGLDMKVLLELQNELQGELQPA